MPMGNKQKYILFRTVGSTRKSNPRLAILGIVWAINYEEARQKGTRFYPKARGLHIASWKGAAAWLRGEAIEAHGLKLVRCP